MQAWRLSFFMIFLSTSLFAQKTSLSGRVTDAEGNALQAVSISIPGYPKGAITSQSGSFELKMPADTSVFVYFSYIGYYTEKVPMFLKDGDQRKVDIQMRRKTETFQEFVVEDEETRRSTLTRLDPKVVNKLPSASGNFEAILFTLPGVTSNNELSSAYSVRGGNYDENLIYVNDVLVYRPFLVRSGQQEGLSFINSDMVSSIQFSAGGFEARYGDRMSSVLDIKYKKPREFGGSVSASLLGGAVHLEDASKDYRFTQIHGLRYRSNQYVLRGLDTQGDYRPSFLDYQTYLTYDLNDLWEVSFMGNISRNRYLFIPETRETDFGTVNEALRLTVFFQGQEIDEYQTAMGAFAAKYENPHGLELKFIQSNYISDEVETFDIEGAYRLDELERDLGSEEFGDVKFNRGVGGFIDHARNYLNAVVNSLEHKGQYKNTNNTFHWGLKYQHEDIVDELSEWYYVDSAGFSSPQGIGVGGWTYLPEDSLQLNPIPVSPRDSIALKEVIRADNQVISNRLMAYGQWDKVIHLDSSELAFTAGARLNYWDLNQQLLFAPRITMSFVPNWKQDVLFRTSWGYYHQPPFYREMRNLFGQVNRNIKAQTSIHYVFGTDINLKLWQRPFKFTGELYYKQLRNLIPYEIDNVRLRYYAENISSGFSRGIDLKLNGEFVKGVESWASLSIMETKEDINNDEHYEYFNIDGQKIIPGFTFDQVAVDSNLIVPGYIPRPTDQRVNFALFFQDYLPKFPSYKMSLNLVFGSGLPFGPPSYNRYMDTLRIPPYRRVDIGFSKQLLRSDREKKDKGPFRHFKEAWIAAEVFNILQINNTISYLWIRDISDRQYAIPNYLTSRRINLRLVASF